MKQTDCSLFILRGDADNQKLSLEGSMIIGRSESCDVVLDEEKVSRRHAKLWREGDEVFLEDMGSTCGTFLNGDRVRASCNIQSGDIINIGAYEFRFEQKSLPAIRRPDVGTENTEGKQKNNVAEETRVASHDEVLTQALSESDASVPGSAAIEETHFAQWEELARDADDHERTRAIVPEGTRLLNIDELPKPRGGGAPLRERAAMVSHSRQRVVVGILVVISLMIGYLLFHGPNGQGDGGMIGYQDPAPRSSFKISYPDSWVLGSEGVFSAEHRYQGGLRARVVVEIERDEAFRYEGFTKAMLREREYLQSIFPGCEIEAERVIVLGRQSRVHFFKLRSNEVYAKTLLLPDDGSRLRIMCATSAKREAEYDQVFSRILDSFSYYPIQFFIDYNMPSPEQQVFALRDPVLVRERIAGSVALAEDLYRLRSADASNLSLAITHLREALTLGAAVVEPPAGVERATRLLYEYQRLQDEQVHFLRGQLEAALRIREWENARQLALNLMRVVGDRTHDLYQEAYRIEEEIGRTGRSYER